MLMARLGVELPGADTAKVAQVTPPAPSEPPIEDKEDVMGIGGWFKKNWIFVLIGAGAVLYLMNRFSKN
jgi:hypothetical protein